MIKPGLYKNKEGKFVRVVGEENHKHPDLPERLIVCHPYANPMELICYPVELFEEQFSWHHEQDL